jgi:hypothetical protein
MLSVCKVAFIFEIIIVNIFEIIPSSIYILDKFLEGGYATLHTSHFTHTATLHTSYCLPRYSRSLKER